MYLTSIRFKNICVSSSSEGRINPTTSKFLEFLYSLSFGCCTTVVSKSLCSCYYKSYRRFQFPYLFYIIYNLWHALYSILFHLLFYYLFIYYCLLFTRAFCYSHNLDRFLGNKYVNVQVLPISK